MNIVYPHIIKFEDNIYIGNPSNKEINKLIYSTKSITFWDDDLIHSARPFYQIDNLNSNAMVKIEDVDSMEEGTIIYLLEEIEFNGISNIGFKPNLLKEKSYHKKTFFKEAKEPPYTKQDCKIIEVISPSRTN